MNAYPIGVSTISVGQRGLDLVGQNIANLATQGYHRQTLNLTSRTADGVNGAGVDVATVTRYSTPPTRAAILRGNSEQAFAATQTDVYQQVETALGSSPGTIADGLEDFFNQVEQLTAQPDSTALRRTTLASAADTAGRFNTAAADIDQLRQNTGQEISRTVDEVNGFAAQIADLNTRIANVEAGGAQANDLRDQRDQVIDQLSQRMDVRTVEQPFGAVNVIASGALVVVGQYANTFSAGPDASGNIVISQAGSSNPVSVASGKLGAQLQAHNVDLPAARARLDTLAQQLVSRVNAVQATGLGLSGPLTSADGAVSVADPNTPLAGQNLGIPLQAGQLTIAVTDSAGNRTNSAIAIDPATQSLSDVAAAITAGTGGNVQASVDPTSNTLKLQAQSGYRFDFAGRAPSSPANAPAVANPDTANALPALGLNGLFQGDSAATIKVRPELIADPNRLAASRTGQPGDATNLEAMAAVRDVPVVGGRTLTGEYTDLAATVGSSVQQYSDQQTAQTSLLKNLNAQEQSTTGVDMNEELVHLLDFQRMIAAGSKYLSVVNTALDSIFDMVR